MITKIIKAVPICNSFDGRFCLTRGKVLFYRVSWKW